MKEKYMELALKEAKKAYNKKEVPVGAVIVKDNKVISKAHNLIETKQNATFHAEILAIKKATKKLKNWRLIDCDMYVTLEPCDMCKNAIYHSRIKNVYYSSSKKNIFEYNASKFYKYDKYIQKTTILLKDFFNNKRKK